MQFPTRYTRITLVFARILLFPIPFRIGFRFSLISEREGPATLKLDLGPWTSASDRALIHILVKSRDQEFWAGILRRLRTLRKERPTTAPIKRVLRIVLSDPTSA